MPPADLGSIDLPPRTERHRRPCGLDGLDQRLPSSANRAHNEEQYLPQADTAPSGTQVLTPDPWGPQRPGFSSADAATSDGVSSY